MGGNPGADLNQVPPWTGVCDAALSSPSRPVELSLRSSQSERAETQRLTLDELSLGSSGTKDLNCHLHREERDPVNHLEGVSVLLTFWAPGHLYSAIP